MDRYAGSMLGLAVGDALGAPVEGMKEGHIRQVFGEVTGHVDPISAFPDRPGKWRLKGLYTDDTQQALAVAEVLAVCGAADLGALADLYVRLAQTGAPDLPFGGHRGTGFFFRRAVAAMAAGADPISCGQPSAGNGAAMRIAPVGLYFVEDEEALGRSAVEISLLTHHDPRGVAAALALAWTVARFARLDKESPPSPTDAADLALEVAEQLPGWVAEWETRLGQEYAGNLAANLEPAFLHQFSGVLEVLASLVREANDDLAAKTILQLANDCGPEAKITHPHAGFAPASVPMALYRALSARDLPNALIATVNAGGDSDTVGAMVGAVLGARFGVEAIPETWIDGLLNADQVRVRAAALRDHEVDWSCWEDYIEMETALTENEAHTLRKAAGDHRKLIEKRKQHRAERKARAAKAAARQPPPDQGFAPPPEVWIDGSPSADSEPADPLQARKDRAKRGRKRVPWKDERRRKRKDPG